ncbi:MAG: hypothetical protein AAF573_02495 [Bacteroidota bacterium]
MRFLLFFTAFLLFSCGGESSDQSAAPATKTESTPTTPNDEPVQYKKTATNSEFAVFRTTNVTDDHMEYFFKTLDGISIKLDVSHEGTPEVKVPDDLLENVKYQEGQRGANPEMAGKVFELIYDSDNKVAEVKLAETE